MPACRYGLLAIDMVRRGTANHMCGVIPNAHAKRKTGRNRLEMTAGNFMLEGKQWIPFFRQVVQ